MEEILSMYYYDECRDKGLEKNIDFPWNYRNLNPQQRCLQRHVDNMVLGCDE